MKFDTKADSGVGLALLSFVLSVSYGFGELKNDLTIPSGIEDILIDSCLDCHEDGNAKGGVRLDQLETLALDARLDLFNQVQEQVFLRQMPPPGRKRQLTEDERKELGGWVAGELHIYGASKLEEKLRYPAYGNAVEHERIFSGEVKEAPYTPARRWLISPQIFDERVKDVFALEGRDRNTQFYGVTNPFLLPDGSGVRYYDNGVLDGGHLLVMLGNADWISQKQIRAARVKNGELAADDFPDPRDKWFPRKTPEEFEAVILAKEAPSAEHLTAAIQRQFQLVLARQATSQEHEKYLTLTREAIELAGHSEGLRQMLIAVLLESEFLYRLEFGAGDPDPHGRRALAPQEAAYAISYALGDRRPDPALMQAAEDGRLQTREDFHREVTRLLAEQEYYRGPVDPAFNTSKVKSHITSHPRINRFFRDFFGYPMAIKVFKDRERSEGYYQNPDRGTLGTPGFLVDEADRLVDWVLQSDQKIFEQLLASDQFFVYHNRSDEEGAQIISEWREVYLKLKDTDWRNKPEEVLAKNLDFIAARPAMRPLGEGRAGELVNFMLFFEESFGQGRTPFTTIPWAHGYTFHHSPFYSLPPTPAIGRYGSWKSTKFDPKIGNEKFWDYPVKQPFKIENRRGILTHPAWLIAHSKNTHNDPVIRGKWVREKLLAGRVPDVPITVDAQIPEDHDRTLRERLESVTLAQDCWRCHVHMNPLGLPFEIFDDFGRHRREEALENPDQIIGKKGNYPIYKTLEIDPRGELAGTGDPKLDGEVTDALDMIERLAKSDRARQSIIRHAFRFFMGRNELLSDSQTLIEAERAYLDSNGSFKAVVLSLLTSDSFRYRR